MHSFALRPLTWPVLRIFSRNPLLRNSDRIEAVVVPLAFFLVVVAAACAGVLGTLAYDVESHRYLDEAKSRHAATATALEDSVPGTVSGRAEFKVRVRWRANGADHTDSLDCDQPVRAGTPVQIWLDTRGMRIGAPTPAALAGGDAVVAAAVAWWIMFLIALMAVGAVRARTARMRDTQWEREIRFLLDGEDGRTNHSQ